MKIIRIDTPLSDRERADVIFNGDLLIHSNINAMHDLIRNTQILLRDSLAELEPTTAQAQLTAEMFLQKTTSAQGVFRENIELRALFFNTLEQCGVNLGNTYYDHIPLRVVPSGTTHAGARNSFIGHHRDTWGSNIHSQINWWAPIYDLEASRTIAIYPRYWTEPLANNTGKWRFEKHIESRRNTPAGLKAPYPSAPSPLEVVDENYAVKVILQPGDVLSFSSAHLHGSVPNTSNQTRYSVEMRTVNAKDLMTGRAAPNVDNQGTTQMFQWFKGITNNQSLAEYIP